MTEERCELSDLPSSQCACRKHAPIPASARLTTDGPTIWAQYEGACVACDEQIEVGDPICPVTSGGWAHEICVDKVP